VVAVPKEEEDELIAAEGAEILAEGAEVAKDAEAVVEPQAETPSEE